MGGINAPKGVLSRYEGVVFDLDGVVYVGGETGTRALPGAAKTIAAARDAGLSVAFMTNNASRTPNDVVGELTGLGIPARAEEVVTSGQAAAKLLAPGSPCLVVGADGLRSVLRERGCVLVDEPEAAEVVVVGFTQNLVWDDLRRATLALAGGARFVGTNADVAFPSAEGLWPGNGAILAALTAASGSEPEIAGKPQAPMFEAAAERLGVQRLLMVGDRAETDIVGAQAVGWDTALVLTGVSNREQAEALTPPPTYVFETLEGLLP